MERTAPYVVVYYVDEDRRVVEIAGVFHTAQGERKL
jgi:plasmid stabilization system protein ParE